MDPLGPLRVDAIFSGLSSELDDNSATLSKKGRKMAHIEVANKTLTTTADSNSLAKTGIKVSVSTLRQDIQRTTYTPLPMGGPPPFFSGEAYVKMENAVVDM